MQEMPIQGGADHPEPSDGGRGHEAEVTPKINGSEWIIYLHTYQL